MCEVMHGLIAVLLVVLAVIDWKKREIPLVYLVILGTLVLGRLLLELPGTIEAKIGGFLIGVLFMIISKCTRQAIGYGDSWIILFLGIYLGGFRVLQLLFVATSLSALFSLLYLWKSKWKNDAVIPFVPFLAVAYVGVIVI